MSFQDNVNELEIKPEMTASAALELYDWFEHYGVYIWIDGGWAVDAVLGEQTRRHNDLDIVVEQKDMELLRSLLEERGYVEIPRDDPPRPHNFVMSDHQGHEIDVHVVSLDEAGNGIYGPPENGDMWPAASLQGHGVIAGQEVRCSTPEQLVLFHTGYDVDEDDYHDVSLLCQSFGLDMPADYDKFKWHLYPYGR